MYLFISIVLSVVCVSCLWTGSLCICLFLLYCQLFVLVVCGQVRYVFVYFYCIVSCFVHFSDEFIIICHCTEPNPTSKSKMVFSYV